LSKKKKKKVLVFVTITFHYSRGDRSDVSKNIYIRGLGSVMDKNTNMCVPRGRIREGLVQGVIFYPNMADEIDPAIERDGKSHQPEVIACERQ